MRFSIKHALGVLAIYAAIFGGCFALAVCNYYADQAKFSKLYERISQLEAENQQLKENCK